MEKGGEEDGHDRHGKVAEKSDCAATVRRLSTAFTNQKILEQPELKE